MPVLLMILISPGSFPLARLEAGTAMEGKPDDRPNLLLIIGDDHGGGTMGIEGDPRQATPNLDTVAREGVLFERAYCNSPLCTPSRQSLITGKLPHAVGVTLLNTRLSDDVLTMGEWFRDQGYQTAAIGKMHFNGPSPHGFALRIDRAHWLRSLVKKPPKGGDHRRPWRPFQDPAEVWLNADRLSAGLRIESMEATFFVDKAIQYLTEHRDRPFALVVGFNEPHCPFPFPKHWAPRFRPEDFPVPELSKRDRWEQPAIFASLSPEQFQGVQAAYYTSLSFLDSQVGRLIRNLDELKLSERTLVVYVGDNGYMLGQHGRLEKHCHYEPAVRVPMIVRWPGSVPGGRRTDELVELVDVLPTVFRLMRLPAPSGLQGVDLGPLVLGEPGARGRDAVFSEYLDNEEAMIRTSRYKLIVGTGRRQRQDGYQTGRPLTGHYQRLFDLASDPGETRDLAHNPGYQDVRKDLLHRMYLRLTTTREGLEPVPAGLSELEAIDWCLVPRDVAAASGQPSEH
jgi:choline-sulfatase